MSRAPRNSRYTIAPIGTPEGFTVNEQRIERLPDVMRRTGLGKTRIYALEAANKFPRRVRISERAVGWYATEIDAFLASRPRASAAPETRTA
jgi:prophage regulatory protein